MGRKNRNAGRVRLKHRRGKQPMVMKPKREAPPPIPIEALVMPDGKCSFQGRPKARFATKEKAQKALRQAQMKRARVGSGHVEKRYYACPDGGCGGYHLTSREEYRERKRA